jgi:arabinogalactan endo-1,4-beta-galactosidase
MQMRGILVFILALAFSGSPLFAQYLPVGADSVHIGADLSLVKAITDRGGVYLVGGNPVNVIETFRSKGFDYARLRLFHTPDGNAANGTVNSLPYTLALAKLIKAAGLKLLLDFHYSDTWADPSKQTKPVAWSALDFNKLNDSIYLYTRKVLDTFSENGVTPDMVQTGNEIDHGMLWPDGRNWLGSIPNYRNLSTLLKSAIRGVRESTGGATMPVVLHAATGGSLADTRIFLDSLLRYDVRFDVIGLSYYVIWHGVMSQLDANLAYLDTHYTQNIIIAETNYQADGTLPAWSVVTQSQLPYPFTQQGQYDYLQGLWNLARKYPKVKGMFYWGGEVIWAGEIGGAWTSLFNWDGKARKALDAFRDLGTGISQMPLEQAFFTILTGSGNLVIRSDRDIQAGTEVVIHDLTGRTLYRKILERTPTQVDYRPPAAGIYLVSVSCKGRVLLREKVMLEP